MDKTRERIYGRVRTDVDNRTSGIRVAAHPTDARGNMNSSAVVHATRGDSFNMWAALAPAFGDVVRAAQTVLNKQEAERQRAEDKAEREAAKAERRAEIERERAEARAEKEMEALASIKADRLALEIDRGISEARGRGEIQNLEQVRGHLSQVFSDLDAESDLAFKKQAASRLYPILLSHQKSIDEQHQQDFTALAQGEISDSIAESYRSLDLDTDEGLQRMSETRQKGKELFLSRGGTESGFNSLMLNQAARAAKNELDRDPVKYRAILQDARRIPGGQQFVDDLQRTLDRELVEQVHKDTERAIQLEQRSYEQNESGLVAKMAAMTPEERKTFYQDFISRPEETQALLGPRLRNFQMAYEQQYGLEAATEGREKEAQKERSTEKAQGYKERVRRGSPVSVTEVLDSDMLFPDKDSVIEYINYVTQEDATPRRALAEDFYNEFLQRVPLEAKFDYPRDEKGLPNFPVELKTSFFYKIDDALLSVRPPGPGASGDDRSKFLSDRLAAGRRAVDALLNMQAGEGTRDATGEEKTLDYRPEHIPVHQLENDPVEQERFEKALISGSGSIETEAKTASGRPLKSPVNWGLYKRLDAERKPIANDILAKHAAQLRAEKQKIPDTWPHAGSPLSQDEIEEWLWRSEQSEHQPSGGLIPMEQFLDQDAEWRKQWEDYTHGGDRKPKPE